jgi:hypothetical protein
MGQIIVGNSNNVFTSTFTASAKTLKISNNTVYDMQFGTLISVYSVTRSAFFDLEGMTVNSMVKTTDSNGIPAYTWTFDKIPASSADGDTLIVTIGCPDIFMNYTVLLKIAGATI